MQVPELVGGALGQGQYQAASRPELGDGGRQNAEYAAQQEQQHHETSLTSPPCGSTEEVGNGLVGKGGSEITSKEGTGSAATARTKVMTHGCETGRETSRGT